jgi:hypothetical protein
MNVKISEFDTAITEILSDFLKANYQTRQEALQAGAEVMVEKLTAASPNGENNFAAHWEVKKYPDAYYAHNTTTVDQKGATTSKKDTRTVKKGKRRSATAKSGIPLSNILEYKTDQKHYRFISNTAKAAESAVLNTIQNKLNGGN